MTTTTLKWIIFHSAAFSKFVFSLFCERRHVCSLCTVYECLWLGIRRYSLQSSHNERTYFEFKEHAYTLERPLITGCIVFFISSISPISPISHAKSLQFKNYRFSVEFRWTNKSTTKSHNHRRWSPQQRATAIRRMRTKREKNRENTNEADSRVSLLFWFDSRCLFLSDIRSRLECAHVYLYLESGDVYLCVPTQCVQSVGSVRFDRSAAQTTQRVSLFNGERFETWSVTSSSSAATNNNDEERVRYAAKWSRVVSWVLTRLWFVFVSHLFSYSIHMCKVSLSRCEAKINNNREREEKNTHFTRFIRISQFCFASIVSLTIRT